MSNLRLHEIISSSLKKREKLQNRETSLIRLIDGQGDNLDGHILESYGKGWLISTSGSNLRSDVREILSSYEKPLYWKRLDQHQKESPIHLCGEELPEFFYGLENGLRCRLSFKSGYSQGIFIDQRNNREALRNMVKPGQTVLNTFAYTGFFSIAAAAAGAVHFFPRPLTSLPRLDPRELSPQRHGPHKSLLLQRRHLPLAPSLC